MKTQSPLFKLLLFLCSFFWIQNLSGINRISTASGAWNNGNTWQGAIIPACGDSITILSGHLVFISNQMDYAACPSPMNLRIFGTLIFAPGSKLKLPCNSEVNVMLGGQMVPGGGFGGSNYLEICNTVQWNSSITILNGPICFGCPIALPVELGSYDAYSSGSGVEIVWTTYSERNNQLFEIERSEDAIHFVKIGSMYSKAESYGNSTQMLHYQYRDQKPIPGTNYYRLKQIDYDQSFAYSRIFSVNVRGQDLIVFAVYPNPNCGEFTADISGIENNHEVTIQLAEEAGRTVYQSSFFLQDSRNSKIHIMPETTLSSGIYLCSLTVEEVAFRLKVLVK
jgi:hypothetical protein